MFIAALLAVCLNGSWEFAFHEDKIIEDVVKADFVATDSMVVPGCFDVMPKWYLKHGTGLYRRTFKVDTAMKDAVLVVEGMGLRAKFMLDGRDLGLYAYPYARLEIAAGALAAGEHTLVAAVDNVMEWPRVKLARPFYDFYFYGGFYHGIKLVEREPKVFVKTVDYAARKIAVKVEGGEWQERVLPEAKLWSPEEPNLTFVEVAGRKVRFGIRQIEIKNKKLYLNGKELFLKGFNRHESTYLDGAATSPKVMLQDIQRLKSVGGNFIRGAHYQQCEQFLDLCDEMGVLVWEESLGWGNGSKWNVGKWKPSETGDAEFCDMQENQTREMVRASFNHPSVIISGFLNECGGGNPEAKRLVDRLIGVIRAEETGHLITFAACHIEDDICCSNVDFIAFNAYPAGLGTPPGTPKEMREKIAKRFNDIVDIFRTRYPEKPIMVSESGAGGTYGMHDPNASVNTEEFQEEYLRDVFETLWANPEIVGYAIWQMNDGRTRERYSTKTVSATFGGSIAGVYDQMRRSKLAVKTVKEFFDKK